MYMYASWIHILKCIYKDKVQCMLIGLLLGYKERNIDFVILIIL